MCRMMHGKRFKVAEARRLLDVVTRVTNPDDLKALQPWPGQSKGALEEMKGMTSEELVARGWHVHHSIRDAWTAGSGWDGGAA